MGNTVEGGLSLKEINYGLRQIEKAGCCCKTISFHDLRTPLKMRDNFDPTMLEEKLKL